MTQTEYDAIKATFPWTEHTTPTAKGGLVRVFDRNGNEVPIFTMTKFLSMITAKLVAPKPAEQEAES